MRTAIIGTGYIAGVHAQALNEMGVSIVFAVDSVPERAKNFAERWNIPKYGQDFSQALAEEVDSIHICTPPALHFSMVKDALEAGKHVVCEKPLCLDNEQACILAKMTSESGLVGAVNFNYRFIQACQEAKKIIASEDFGHIFLIHGSYLQEFHALPAEYLWRYDSKLAGLMRATTEIGSHWMDLARFWTGMEIEAVSASFGNFNPVRYLSEGMMYKEHREGCRKLTVDSDDVALVTMKFAGGAIGSVTLSEISHGRINRLSLEVSGSKKSVWWNSEEPNYLNVGSKGEDVRSRVNAFGGGFPDTFRSFFTEVYKDIGSGHPSKNPVYPTFTDGMKIALICNAIYRSATEGSRPVEVNG